FPEEGTVTCTVCPNGCQVRWDEKTGTFSGTRCMRGSRFAMQERTSPMRTVTTTVKTEGGKLVPVRTDGKIGRDSVRGLVEKLREVRLQGPHRAGDVVYTAELDGKEVRILSTASD
ncbi:MAG: DUF1667 domain-containing protein, partial [Spirochaetales bacterium]|nr:DUF1667 domain-containing protein [Spirochaetales bacterium]